MNAGSRCAGLDPTGDWHIGKEQARTARVALDRSSLARLPALGSIELKTLIYQFWNGKLPGYARLSRNMMRAYAQQVGADYRFDLDPKYFRTPYARYFNALRPVFDRAFHAYDRVLFVDMDVFPVDGLEESIFHQEIGDIAMCAEKGQSDIRTKRAGHITIESDLKWAEYIRHRWKAQAPRDRDGIPTVFNSGVVMYSGEGMAAAREKFATVWSYILWMYAARFPKFYRLDQNYLGCFAFIPGIRFTELESRWNAQVISIPLVSGETILIDNRNHDTNFVHLQHQDKRTMSDEEILNFARRRSAE